MLWSKLKSFDDVLDACKKGSVMVLGDAMGDSFWYVVSRCVVLLFEESQLSELLLDTDIFRREADEHFRRFKRSSGLPRIKDWCAYMSVSGPLRTFEKPYKFKFLWKELNFFVRKYLGRTEVVNPSTSRIRKANPDSDQKMYALFSGEADAIFASPWSIS